jgi:hypothetical protein
MGLSASAAIGLWRILAHPPLAVSALGGQTPVPHPTTSPLVGDAMQCGVVHEADVVVGVG